LCIPHTPYYAGRKQSSACYLLHNDFLFGIFLILKIEVTCTSKTLVDFSRIYIIISQKIELLLITTVITSNLTRQYTAVAFYVKSTFINLKYEVVSIISWTGADNYTAVVVTQCNGR
jgi:hypothetical protein